MALTHNSAPPPAPPATARPGPMMKLAVTTGIQQMPQRIGLFGPGGIGKTTLATSLASVGKRPLIVDLDRGSHHLDARRISNVASWSDLRTALADTRVWTDYDFVVIDSLTKAQDLCAASIMQAERVKSLEFAGGGYGKGYRFLYENMLSLLDDLDRHVRDGRNVLLIMHEFVAKVPNPMGTDFIRFEPNLYAADKVSVRHRVKEWLDHLFFVGYDVFAKDGKAKGSGTRTIYPQEMPTHWAKSRKLSAPIPFTSASDSSVWNQLFSS